MNGYHRTPRGRTVNAMSSRLVALDSRATPPKFTSLSPSPPRPPLHLPHRNHISATSTTSQPHLNHISITSQTRRSESPFPSVARQHFKALSAVLPLSSTSNSEKIFESLGLFTTSLLGKRHAFLPLSQIGRQCFSGRGSRWRVRRATFEWCPILVPFRAIRGNVD